MRRFIIVTLAALGLVLSTLVPAYAQMHKVTCKSFVIDAEQTNKVCMEVYYHAMAGAPGVSIDKVYLEINVNNAIWDSPAVTCNTTYIRNSNDITVWRKDNQACDVPEQPGYKLFNPQQDMPQSPYAVVRWYGNANINAAPDKDFVLQITADQ